MMRLKELDKKIPIAERWGSVRTSGDALNAKETEGNQHEVNDCLLNVNEIQDFSAVDSIIVRENI